MYNHHFILKAALAAIVAAFATQVYAEKAACEEQNLIIATGPAGKGYSKLFADINKVCGQVVSVCELNSTGGLDNLDLLSEKKADVGFAQIDTWTHMKTGNDNISALQAILGLNSNYLHVVTAINGFVITGEKKMLGLMSGDNKTVVINRFSDLRGQRVALVGSAQLLVRQLNKFLDFKMEMKDVDSDAEAFNMVRKGEVASAISVSGWPSGVIAPLKQDSGLTLVPYDVQISSNQFFVKPITYKGLGVYNNNALAIPNVLFTRPFKGEKSREVAKLRECLKSKLLDLQEGSYQPGWNEIKDIGNTYDIPKFSGK